MTDNIYIKFANGVLDIYAEKKRFRVNTRGEVRAVGKIISSMYEVDGLAEVLYDFIDKVLEEPWLEYSCRESTIFCLTEGFAVELNGRLIFKTRGKSLQCIITAESVKLTTLIGTFVDVNTKAKHEDRIGKLIEKHNLLIRGEEVRVSLADNRLVIKSTSKGKGIVIDPWSIEASCRCIINLNERIIDPEIILKWVEGVAYEAVKDISCDIEVSGDKYIFKYGNFVFEYNRKKKIMTKADYQSPELTIEFDDYFNQVRLRGNFLKVDLKYKNLSLFYQRLTEIFEKLVKYLEF